MDYVYNHPDHRSTQFYSGQLFILFITNKNCVQDAEKTFKKCFFNSWKNSVWCMQGYPGTKLTMIDAMMGQLITLFGMGVLFISQHLEVSK